MLGVTGAGKSYTSNLMTGAVKLDGDPGSGNKLFETNVGGADSWTKVCTRVPFSPKYSPDVLRLFHQIAVSDTVGFMDT